MNVKQDIVNELHKPARRVFKRRRVIIKGLHDLMQIDLVEMIPYAKVNKGFRYILTAINAFSKYAYAIPVKRKTGKDVVDAMKKILLSVEKAPKNIQSDDGKEFMNKEFHDLMQKHNINHYSTFSSLKGSIVERFNRTLKNSVWKQFSLQGNFNWTKILPKILEKYNNSKHSTIKMKPTDVNKRNERYLLDTVYSNIKTISLKRSKLRKGDFVRISKHRSVFTKGYLPSWSTEVFKIRKIKETNPHTFIIEDERKQEIKGGFYEEELQKVKHPNVYLVEKILRKKGNKVLVRWLGIKGDTWVLKKDVLN